MIRRRVLLLSLVTLTAACTGLGGRDPLQVAVAGVEPLPGAGLELRLLVKLRIQNPNDTPVGYDGVYLKLDVQGSTFATGVSDATGTIPRFGEAVIDVPVTASAFRMARQVMGMMDGAPTGRLRYDLTGKLNGVGLGATRFRSDGELTLPATPGGPAAP
jgi:hypothetical protein